MKTAKITTVVDNTAAGHDLEAEHGLSIWIETPGAFVLFDTGQGPALRHNAVKLGIPVDRADAIVLSHGHYDHTGGLDWVLNRNSRAAVYMHPDAVMPRFSRHADGTFHAIGMPSHVLDAINAAEKRVEWITRPRELADGIWVSGPIPRETGFEDVGGSFFLDADCTQPDSICDDQAMWIETEQGVVVVLGCAHSGVVNTLNYIAKTAGVESFHSVIGGMHLGRADQQRLDATLQALRDYRVQTVMPLHCTGPAATAFLVQQLKH